jgi:heme exporter protein B
MKGLSWRQFAAILRKDIRMEWRTKEMITSMGLYALLTMVVYAVALNAAGTGFDVLPIAGGLLWAAFTFMSMLGLNRSLVHEKDQGCLEALLLSPVDRPVIFFAKAGGNFLFVTVVELLALPFFYFFFLQGRGVQGNPLLLIPVLVLGTAGIAGIGTLLATISVNTRGKDFLLTVLFVPIAFPLLAAVVSATAGVLLGGDAGMARFWQGVGISAGYDVIMLSAAYGLYEFVIGA